MSGPDKRYSVSNFKPRPQDLLAMVRRSAADTRNVKFSEHALDRMEERGITTLDAIRVLRTGEIEGGIVAGNRHGEWKVKIVAPIRGNREVGVATIVMMNGKLFIKTVEWEDL